jgi:hypothetical protein
MINLKEKASMRWKRRRADNLFAIVWMIIDFDSEGIQSLANLH